MHFTEFSADQTQPVIRFFTDVFGASEGLDEGRIIGQLVAAMIADTDAEDLVGFVALDDKKLAGCILFSRLRLSDDQSAFILSPAAVASDLQGQGVGQAIIRHGLDALKERGVDWVFTYGDPAFYGKTGFRAISEAEVKAPQPLSHPHGWIAQSLCGNPVTMSGVTSQCVTALDKPEYW